jgi:hypothetical protein
MAIGIGIANHFADNGYLTGLIGKMLVELKKETNFTAESAADAEKKIYNRNSAVSASSAVNARKLLVELKKDGPKVQHYANEIANHPLGPHFFNTVDDGGAGLPDVDPDGHRDGLTAAHGWAKSRSGTSIAWHRRSNRKTTSICSWLVKRLNSFIDIASSLFSSLPVL